MTRIYTRKGDRGDTGILGNIRMPKSDARIRALGALDESNAALGVVLAQGSLPADIAKEVAQIQSSLFEAGAAVANPDPGTSADFFRTEATRLEQVIDRSESELAPLTQFILPGGGLGGASLHWGRTAVRRAESLVVEAVGSEEERMPLITWLNRLSDTLFVLARLANRRAGIEETLWRSQVDPS